MVRIISALILSVAAVCASAAEPLKLVDNPPDQYVVVRGDTLWGISGKFLQQPWRWPEIWRMNKDQIKDPHWIYPGDIIYLDYSDGTPRLRKGTPVVGGYGGKGGFGPKVYSEAADFVPSIPSNIIEPFLSQPLIIEPGEHDGEPRVIATQEDRILVGNGDEVYVEGIPDASVEKWQVYRPGKPLIDPDTGKVIAHEAFFLGYGRLIKPGDPATVRMTMAKEEVTRGDRLIPEPPANIIAYVPRRPEAEVEAKIVSVYGGLTEGGPNSVITFNQGRLNGLEEGHVIALYRNRVSVDINMEDGKRIETPIPQERYGLAFVFRVFNNISYALVVESSRAVIIGDSIRNP